MSLVTTFDPEFNFWDANPQFKLVGKFKELYNSDKSKKKEISSIKMHFVSNCYDKDSKFEKMPIKDKHELVGEDICGDKKIYQNNKFEMDELIKFYIRFDDNTAARRGLRTWEKKMDERSEFIDTTPYTLDNADQLDKLMSNTKKLYDDYKRIVEDLSKEDNNSSAKGDRELSLSDRGVI